MKNLISLSIVIILLVCTTIFSDRNSAFAQKEQKGNRYSIDGNVVSASSGEQISFATILDELSGLATMCDIKGNFKLNNLKPGNYKFEIRSLGFATKKLDIKLEKDIKITIKLQEQSYALKEVNVMAKYQGDKGSSATIEKTALEYIQPVSILDALVLLPGNVYGGNSMTKFNSTGSRQIGGNSNSSLGIGLVSDGIPISDDGMRNQMAGVTSGSGSSDGSVGTNKSINSGVDMRHLSVDHMESIKIVRGISSAKLGNMSSGSVQIQSKQGRTPYQVRVKADPLTKFIYGGKGFKIRDNLGTLHIGLDALNSRNDVMSDLDEITRITGQANYTNKTFLFGKKLDINSKLSFITSTNGIKEDNVLKNFVNKYKNDYHRSTFSAKGKWELDYNWINNLELVLSSDITRDYLHRELFVSSTNMIPKTFSQKEGSSIGYYIPGIYKTSYSIENLPISFFFQLNGLSKFQTGTHIRHNLIYGTEFKSTKNIGKGAELDPYRPPFPNNNSYIRPRPNYVIPALMHTAVYVEDETSFRIGKHLARLTAGIRGTKMLNLPNDYLLSKRFLIEPRLQASFSLNNSRDDDSRIIKNIFRIGYGQENKLPTLDFLYPDKIYRDFAELTQYNPTIPENSIAAFHTIIHDPTNKDIIESKNTKHEFGWDFIFNDVETSLTVFQENANGGFEYFSEYFNIAYNRYTNAKYPIISKPTLDDFYFDIHRNFTSLPKVSNSSKTIKQGLEYRISLPMIPAIYTKIEINGAYYTTTYTRGVPVQYRPEKTFQGKQIPYIGIYDGDVENILTRLNTNIWFNTHIPSFKLIFSNFLQIVWFSTSQNGKGLSYFPSQIMDLDGNLTPITPEEILDKSNPEYLFLSEFNRTKSEKYFVQERKAISIMLNFKVTKEINKHMKVSFFANNLADFNPRYKNKNKQTSRRWGVSFFGAELLLTL